MIPDVGDVLAVEGDEAHHALRVKRLEPGSSVRVADGLGTLATARLERAEKLPGKGRSGSGWRAHLRITDREISPKPRPEIVVASGVPKGPRLETLIEGLSQAGAAGWRPLESTRSVVDPRPGKLARLDRVTMESAKQCGRAWAMTIGPSTRLAGLLTAGAPVIVADASGPPLDRLPPSDRLVLAVGPEGGFDADELAAAAAAGATIAAFGPHTMRIETAAPVACSILQYLARVAHPSKEAPS